LDYVDARYYTAADGRWMQQDPTLFNAGDSNLYRYVNNQPTDMTDPSGLVGEDFVDPAKERKDRERHNAYVDSFLNRANTDAGPSQFRPLEYKNWQKIYSPYTPEATAQAAWKARSQQQQASWVADALRSFHTPGSGKTHEIKNNYYVTVLPDIDGSKAAVYYKTKTTLQNSQSLSGDPRSDLQVTYVGFWANSGVSDDRIFKYADDNYAAVNNRYAAALEIMQKSVDYTQQGLDVLGLVPGFGVYAVALSGAISLAKGDYGAAALAFGSILIPAALTAVAGAAVRGLRGARAVGAAEGELARGVAVATSIEAAESRVVGSAARSAPGTPAAGEIPPVIYREGRPSPSNLTPRPQDGGHLSFRDSLSNPIQPGTPGPLGGQRPVLRPGQDYMAIDTSRLPPGSVIPDGVPGSLTTPPGHVSVVDVPPDVLRNAVIPRPPTPPYGPGASGRFPQ